MKLYLCGRSALSVLRHLREVRDERLFEPRSRIRALSDPLYLASHLGGLSRESERLLSHAGDEIHCFVPDRGMCNSGARICTHLWSRPLPGGAFIRLADDLLISSPEFVFLQLSHELELFELAALGMELCGTYARTEDDSGLQREWTAYGKERGIAYQVDAVATARRLGAFAGRAPGSWGVQNARKVSPWLADGAASPMESAAYLMLTLPKRLGGYALPKPILNPRVSVRTTHGTEERFPDLYWQGRAIDVEYQSDLAHSGDWSRYRDSRRQVTLTTNRITVLPLTRAQLMDSGDFHDFAMGLKRLLGVRKRGEDSSWWQQRARLRRALLLGE